MSSLEGSDSGAKGKKATNNVPLGRTSKEREEIHERKRKALEDEQQTSPQEQHIEDHNSEVLEDEGASPQQENPKYKVEVLEPGLVKIHKILSPAEQLIVAQILMEIGSAEKDGFYRKKRDGSSVFNVTKTRGRMYQSLSWYEERVKDDHNNERILSTLCRRAVEIACRHDKNMPEMTPTHLLVLYYASETGIKFHQDKDENDGTGTHPVVSFSLGNDCSFCVRHQRGEEPKKIQLESGDAILFGGPSRMITHAVTKVYMGTSPALSDVLGDARMNLTFRHTPEILGREKEFQNFRKALAYKRDRDRGEDAQH